MIKQIEKMPNLGKGSVFQSTVLTIIHKISLRCKRMHIIELLYFHMT